MQRSTSRRFSPLTIVIAIVALCTVSAFGYTFFAPPAPGEEASQQLGGLALTVLGKPTSVEAFELCDPQAGCTPSPSETTVFKDTTTQSYIVAKHLATVTPASYRHLQTVLYTDANYKTAGQMQFYPSVVFRVHGSDTEYVDVMIDTHNTKIRIIPFSDPTDNESGTWISSTMTLDDLKSAVIATFPNLK